MIDTEPAREDIYKMLLGSLDPEYDILDNGGPEVITEAPEEETTEDPKSTSYSTTDTEGRKTGTIDKVFEEATRRLSNGAPANIRRGSSQQQLTSITEHSSADKVDTLGFSPSGDTFTPLEKLPSITHTHADDAVEGAERLEVSRKFGSAPLSQRS